MADEVLQRADALQLLGDGLLAAVDQHAEGARGAASACAATLRQRGWDGDDLLADHLEGLIGAGPALTLTPLAVDLEELANILEGDPVYGGGRIDRRTGEVWPQPAIDYAVELGDEDQSDSESSDRWLRVECLGSVESYRDMEFFIGAVEDARKANRLVAAIDGRGAFRRFRDGLGDWPEELDRWYAISEERQRGRARVLLAERRYCVSPGPESLGPAATNDPLPPCRQRSIGRGHRGPRDTSYLSDLPDFGVSGAEIAVIVDSPPFFPRQMPWQRFGGETVLRIWP